MIFGRLRVTQRDQRGLTLVELLIAILLAGIITSGITMTIFQVFNINSRTSNHMTAIRQVQHAGKQVSEDLLQAKRVEPGGSSGFPLTLNWTDWDDEQHGIVYNLEDMPSGELKILWREHYINLSLNSTTNIAEYIDPAETSFIEDPEDPGAFIFTVTANVSGQSETRIYEIMPRAASQ
jgi:prepilin-type N-terminal cleavage/methylation domain-containing protein